jgi:16S rRNA processing protein RimM
MDLVVGRIGRAHGVAGEVTVELRTDDPETRFAPDTVLRTDPAERGPLTIRSVRSRPGGLIVGFAGVSDRAGASSLRGTFLVVDASTLPALDDPDEFYDHQLVGLAAVLLDGRSLGTVREVLHPPGADLLVIRADDGPERLVPFVTAMVPTVDVPGGRVVVDPPEGLLEL